MLINQNNKYCKNQHFWLSFLFVLREVLFSLYILFLCYMRHYIFIYILHVFYFCYIFPFSYYLISDLCDNFFVFIIYLMFIRKVLL